MNDETILDKCRVCDSEAIDVTYFGGKLSDVECRKCGHTLEFKTTYIEAKPSVKVVEFEMNA